MSQKKKTDNEEEALEGALSPIVNRLIDKNFEKSGDKIASQMAPLIGGAIREQIKSQKDDIVDALYPVMGNMISKFVTKSFEELLNKINQQIQSGLSTQTIKRKLKAKLKGVSETELLLEENAHAKIKAALLIHKESGMLLTKVENEDANLSDADMLASMMTAIRSFVNEWVASNQEHQELGEIEYGGNKIIIEASGSSYLAVIVEGAAYTKTYNKIRHALEEIVLEYGDEIQEFQGDYSQLKQEEIEKKLQELLFKESDTKNKQAKENKTHPLLYIVPLLLLLFFAYKSYESYVDESLKDAITHNIVTTPALSPYAITIDVEDKNAVLKGRVPFAYHKELAYKKAAEIKGVTQISNNIEIIPTLTDPMQVSAQIAYLLKGLNLSSANRLNYTFDYKNLHLFGTIDSHKQKESLLKELSTIKGIENIQDDIIVTPLKINTALYFGRGSYKLSPLAQKELLSLLIKLKKKERAPLLVLDAYSDMIGSKAKNTSLAQKRMQNIIDFLKTYDSKLTFKSYVHHNPPKGVDPQKDHDKARCVTITAKEEK